MILYPAIDIRDGKAVRLTHGRFEDETVYHDDPLEAARVVGRGGRALPARRRPRRRAGGRAGARSSTCAGSSRAPACRSSTAAGCAPSRRCATRCAAGAERVIVGTAALRDVDFLDDIVAAYGPRVVVSVDVRGGQIATAGWTQVTDMPAADAIERLHDRGVASFVYTDADRDGALEGPDARRRARRSRPRCAGASSTPAGSATLEHLRALRGAAPGQPAGVIVGKALYERRFTVAEAPGRARRQGLTTTGRGAGSPGSRSARGSVWAIADGDQAGDQRRERRCTRSR